MAYNYNIYSKSDGIKSELILDDNDIRGKIIINSANIIVNSDSGTIQDGYKLLKMGKFQY